MGHLKELSDAATPGEWSVGVMGDGGIEKSRYENGAVGVFSADCAHHPVADFSCNHTCRMGYECEDNAAFVAALVNAYRSGALREVDIEQTTKDTLK